MYVRSGLGEAVVTTAIIWSPLRICDISFCLMSYHASLSMIGQ